MTSSIRVAILTVALAASLTAHTALAERHLHVVTIGDSLAYGIGDEEGKGIAGRLEPELRDRGIESVVTANLAANGATTRDVSARLREPETRSAIARANAVVLSVGANDFRLPLSEQTLRSPRLIVEQVLRDIDATVAELHRINPTARIFVLGAYTPVPHQRAALLLEPLVAVWDATLIAQFADNPLVSVVRLSDIVDRPERLSTLDSFHPGGEAYQHTARRIAELLAAK
jgi:lysophospholipase L1-like esterase